MCNRYRPASVTYIRDVFGFTSIKEREPYSTDGIGPWQQGPFVRAAGLDVGQWGLIPWFSKTKRPTGKMGRPSAPTIAESKPWRRRRASRARGRAASAA